MDLDKSIKERHSVRKFSNKQPNWRDIIECIDTMRYAPTAGANTTLKIIMVSDKDKIRKIADACSQDFVGQVYYVVVVCSNSERLENAYGKNGEKFNKQQVGAAIQNFLLKIQEKKLATCWVGYFVEYMIKEILTIPEDIQVEAVFPIGYEFDKPKTRKEKIDIDNILYFDEYKNKKMNKIKKIDV